MKHTPGPWLIKRWPNIICADGFETVITDSRGHGIAIFNQKGENEKVRANGKLIATSPELLQELKDLRARVTKMSQAMANRGLGIWVRDWLGDGILDCPSINKAEGKEE